MKKMLPCKQDCEISELRQLYFTSIDQIYSIIPFIPYPSRCIQNILNFIHNGTQMNIELKSEIIQSIFSQVDPVFLQIYKMMNGNAALNNSNVTIHIDPIYYLMNGFNHSVEVQNKYKEMNTTVLNMTVIFYFL
jgi:hypothetical protein